jgi:hypothetical protein
MIELCSVYNVVCSINESRTLSIVSAGSSIIDIMKHFPGFVFISVLMICVSQCFNHYPANVENMASS